MPPGQTIETHRSLKPTDLLREAPSMADSQTSPPTSEPNSQTPETENPNPQSNQPDSSSSTPSTSLPVNPNPTPLPLPPPPPIPTQLAFQSQLLQAHTPPSFRPLVPHFSPLPNPNFQNPNVQQPGVSPVPGMVSVAGTGGVYMQPPMMMSYAPPPGQPPNPAFRSYVPMPNAFPQGTIPPPVYWLVP